MPPPCKVDPSLRIIQQSGRTMEDGPAFLPYVWLDRTRRIDIGMMCKRILDTGRLLWLREQGWCAQSVLYVAPDITGENRLMIAT